MTKEAAFDDFVRENQERLWQAIVPLAGPDATSDAVADALAYAWQHWDRVSAMDNPSGYLYTMARRDAVRIRPAPLLPLPEAGVLPDVEPGLPAALAPTR